MHTYLITTAILGIVSFILRMWILGDFKNRYIETTQKVYASSTVVSVAFLAWAIYLLMQGN